jgi:hypothetical protein
MLVLAAVIAATPIALQAQDAAKPPSGKWVATLSNLSVGGAADVTIEPRNDKQSRARVAFRNLKKEMRISWDIVAGNCRDEGRPIAAQAAFTNVQLQMDGSGTATANIPKLESGKPYYVRVFDPQTPPSDGAAFGCANLAEKP